MQDFSHFSLSLPLSFCLSLAHTHINMHSHTDQLRLQDLFSTSDDLLLQIQKITFEVSKDSEPYNDRKCWTWADLKLQANYFQSQLKHTDVNRRKCNIAIWVILQLQCIESYTKYLWGLTRKIPWVMEEQILLSWVLGPGCKNSFNGGR